MPPPHEYLDVVKAAADTLQENEYSENRLMRFVGKQVNALERQGYSNQAQELAATYRPEQ